MEAGVPCKLKPSSEMTSRSNKLAALCGPYLGGLIVL